MSSLLQSVDLQTRLAGHNRLELLIFYLDTKQQYAINVFKVHEVIRCPRLTPLPESHPSVKGVGNSRGRTIPVIDLAEAIGLQGLGASEDRFIVVTEYNRSIQGFLVAGTERIVNLNWEEVLPPPPGLGSSAYLTAVTRMDQTLVQILDVEKVLSEVMPREHKVTRAAPEHGEHRPHVLVADDSLVARKQIQKTLAALDIDCTTVNDGRAALDQLLAWEEEGTPLDERLLMVISDIEMPKMDGYSLTRQIREREALKGLHVVLHTSMSGVFNENMVKSVGADHFLPKFDADSLADAILDRIKATE